MMFRSVTGLLCLIFTVCILLGPLANADKVEHPIRLRLDSRLIKRIFMKGDETILDNFKELDVGQIPPIPEQEEEDEEEETGEDQEKKEEEKEEKPKVEIPEAIISDLIATIKPKMDTGEDYDFTLALNDKDLGYLGIQGDNLMLEGSGKVAATSQQFTFTADVSLLRMRVVQQAAVEPEVLSFNPNAEEFVQQGLELVFEDFKFEPALEDPQMVIQIQERVHTTMVESFDEIWDGELDKLVNLPVQSLLPMLLIRHLGAFTQKFQITEDHLEFGIDMEEWARGKYASETYESAHTQRKKKLLKEIESEFIQPKDSQDRKAIQLIIDENAINQLILDPVLLDGSISLREMLWANPNTLAMVDQMRMGMLAMMLPELSEEFDENRAIDFRFSASHDLIKDHLPEQRLTGFNIDKNGNFRFTVNVYAQLLVDKTIDGLQWTNARDFYLGFAVKGKLVIEEMAGRKDVHIVPKSAELGEIKILDSTGREQVSAQMMVQSTFNVYFEKLIKQLPALRYPLSNPPTPRELECLGFKLTKANIEFRKRYMEFSWGYRMVKEPSSPEICEMFSNFLRNGPSEIIDKTQEILADPKGFVDEHKEDIKGMAEFVSEGNNKRNKKGGKGTLRDKQGGKKKKEKMEFKDAVPEEEDIIIIDDL